jgi:hypothetical protein
MGTLGRVLGFLLTWACFCAAQVTIIDSGSTNIPGMNIKLESSGPQAMVEHRDGSTQKITLAKDLCDRLIGDLKVAGPLNQLPVRHCAKSVSFGTSLYVEYNGVRSPDLSCRQADEHVTALKVDADAILSAVRANNPPRYHR